MAKDGSVAPKERINITYKPASGDQKEEVELPLRLLMLGDYTGRADDTPVEERRPIEVDKDNFNSVLAEQGLELDLNVEDRLAGESSGEIGVHLEFKHMKDFSPEAIAEQVPELRRLMELRTALTALKGPLGNIPRFRKTIEALLGDQATRERLIKELGLQGSDED